MASSGSETAAASVAHYLDSSALVKLVIEEPETGALRTYLDAAAGIVVSEIALTEIPRAVQNLTVGLHRAPREAAFEAAQALLRGVALVPLNRELLIAAGRFNEARLRSLDAIHLASALLVADDVESFVTYDKRQAAAGEGAGLKVASPGAG